MEKLITFLANNTLWFLLIVLILVFALIGFFVDNKNQKKDNQNNDNSTDNKNIEKNNFVNQIEKVEEIPKKTERKSVKKEKKGLSLFKKKEKNKKDFFETLDTSKIENLGFNEALNTSHFQENVNQEKNNNDSQNNNLAQQPPIIEDVIATSKNEILKK